MTHKLFLVLCVFAVLTCASAQTMIYDCNDLQNMKNDLGGNYALANDIDCSDTVNWNGGAGFEPVGTFSGRLAGQGYGIIDLVINRPAENFIGLFGSTRGTAIMISSLGIVGGSISGKEFVGGLVGESHDGTFNNVYTACSVLGTGDYIGGLVGQSWYATISNSYSTSSVSAVSGTFGFVGGMVGLNYYGIISNAYATGSVSGSRDCVGGLLGGNFGSISNSYSTGSVSGISVVGGLAGTNGGTLINIYATGSVFGIGSLGGLVGSHSGVLSNAYATGLVSGTGNNVGGVLGAYNGGVLSNNFWDTQTSGQSTSGGGGGASGKTTLQMYAEATFQGWDFNCTWRINEGEAYPQLTFSDCSNRTVIVTTCTELQNAVALTGVAIVLQQDIDCTDTANWNSGAGFLSGTALALLGTFNGQGYNIVNLTINRPTTNGVGLLASLGRSAYIHEIGLVGGSITGASVVGGLLGWNDYGVLSNAYTAVPVSGTGSYVGGLVGFNHGIISSVYTMGNVSGAAGYVGGLVGYNYYGTISTAYTTGSVLGVGDCVGGLLGRNEDTLNNVYATGSVSGSNYVGGLVGYNNNGDLSNTYATGNVIGFGNYIGGLVGYQPFGTTTQSYWDKETSGQTTSAAGIGKTTVEMQQQVTYVNWNFINIWWVCDQNYPKLRTIAPPPAERINITSCVELQSMCLHLNYQLVSNVDCSNTANWNEGSGFEPIGYRDDTRDAPFTGSLDGRSYVVYSLTIYRPGARYVGLFGYMCCLSAEIMNIGLEEANITGELYVGGLVGYQSSSTITESYLTGSVLGLGDYIGGLVGYNDYGLIRDCYASGNTAGADFLGGLVGFSSGSVIESQAIGNASGSTYVGGLVGWQEAGSIMQSYAVVGATGSNGYVGGLVGFSSGSIRESQSIGDVSGSTHVGGLVGWQEAGSIIQSYATGSVASTSLDADSYVGGLVSYVGADVVVNKCYATGDVNNTSGLYAGGLIGWNNGVLKNSYATGDVTGNIVGALVGGMPLSPSSLIQHSYAVGCVSGTRTGGLVGTKIEREQFVQCYWDTRTTGQRFATGQGTNRRFRSGGKKTSKLYQSSTFKEWDFEKVWGINETHSYPFLLENLPDIPPIGGPSCRRTVVLAWIDDLAIVIAVIGGVVVLRESYRFYTTHSHTSVDQRPLLSVTQDIRAGNWQKYYPLITLGAFIMEVIDRVFDCYFIQELEDNRERTLALFAFAFFLTSYLLGLLGLRRVDYFQRKDWREFAELLITLPVACPELARFKWQAGYMPYAFARLKTGGILVDDIPQFVISIVFSARKGFNPLVIARLVVALLFAIIFIAKLWFYDLAKQQNTVAIKTPPNPDIALKTKFKRRLYWRAAWISLGLSTLGFSLLVGLVAGEILAFSSSKQLFLAVSLGLILIVVPLLLYAINWPLILGNLSLEDTDMLLQHGATVSSSHQIESTYYVYVKKASEHSLYERDCLFLLFCIMLDVTSIVTYHKNILSIIGNPRALVVWGAMKILFLLIASVLATYRIFCQQPRWEQEYNKRRSVDVNHD